MRVLAIDTTTDLGSVAVRHGGALVAEVAARVRARHGEVLLPRVETALDAAGLTLAEVDLVVVTVGPGSFTGVRVGVATAKGLALGAGKPIVGVGSLETLAAAVVGAGPGALVGAVLDAHKGEVFYAGFRLAGGDRPTELVPPSHAAPADAGTALARAARTAGCEEVVLVGDGLRGHGQALVDGIGDAVPVRTISPLLGAPRAAWAAVLGEARHRSMGPDDLARLEPRYVRPSDARLPGSRG